ncbi:hypothetical protein AMAG_01924 [Allomyces macrogynus ATCC 38327]|uniref:UspA domain-containing protein n=1 Tax=Allomyces macrogynus (strain ATCC 38327) TaxID=578462 RepID=A0A0L0S124_ALLM3|nr:hypothetical protein AMAG_01924 [Allomyces macrogynus ATCC 38327]|eukprot:KNE56081.1 hypothetical protein AMAG_01924 [Allomyces macrogynus ATCC 38327]
MLSSPSSKTTTSPRATPPPAPRRVAANGTVSPVPVIDATPSTTTIARDSASTPTPTPTPVAAHLAPRTVLISLDASPHSAYAFAWAVDHLLLPQDHIVLVNVRALSASHAALYHDETGAQYVRDLDDEHRAASHALLQHYGATLRHAGFSSVRAISIRGDARADVVRKAHDIDATVVVCGSRGLGSIKRAFLGSVSTYLVHHCACPVLVIRPPTEGDAQTAPPETVRVNSNTSSVVALDQPEAPPLIKRRLTAGSVGSATLRRTSIAARAARVHAEPPKATRLPSAEQSHSLDV